MIGMNASTGTAIDDSAHLKQSIADILTTPLGSRIQRRDYGSLLPELIDQPFNSTTRLRLYGAVATALMRWEPRISLRQVEITRGTEPGQFVLDVVGQRNNAAGTSTAARLSIPLSFRPS